MEMDYSRLALDCKRYDIQWAVDTIELLSES